MEVESFNLSSSFGMILCEFYLLLELKFEDLALENKIKIGNIFSTFVIFFSFMINLIFIHFIAVVI